MNGKLKNIFFTFLLLCSSFLSYSQEERKNSFGISLGLGKANIVSSALDGGPTISGKASFEVGINYYRKIDHKLMFESGISWYTTGVSFKPHSHPGMDGTSTNYDIALLYVPLFFRRTISDNFYIAGGFIPALDISRDSPLAKQSGLGSGISFGGAFSVSERLILQITPYLNLHGLLVFENKSYPERILDSGIKVGLRMR